MFNILIEKIGLNNFCRDNEVSVGLPKNRPILFFIFVVVLYFIYQIIMQPKLMLNGEMWAEMAINYYLNANSPSLLTNLIATDAGYIPLPQRLIALIASGLGFPAITIPYFYTWIATIFSAVLVGAFCLPPFRKIIPSDYFRFFACLIILMIVDFETKTFINFTYFSAFFIAIITALALSDNSEDVPRWAWFIPFLFITKPAVMAALPAMIVVALMSKSRFRLITFASLIACCLQIIQLLISSSAGIMPHRDASLSFFSKLLAAIKYNFGFLGSHIMGPNLKAVGMPSFFLGIIIIGLCLYFIVFSKNTAKSLIFVGIPLLSFNVLLNTFALSKIWNLDMQMLNGILINRHIIIGFHGIILIVCGIIYCLTDMLRFRVNKVFLSSMSVLLLGVWFFGSGFFSQAVNLSKEPKGFVNNSQWINMATALDADASPICVPINPWDENRNWMYRNNCDLLNSSPWWNNGSVQVNNDSKFLVSLATAQQAKNLVSAAIIVKPISLGSSSVEASMEIELNNGQIILFQGSRIIDEEGGLLMLTGLKPVPISSIKSASLTFSSSVDVARNINEPIDMPGVAWMGN